MAKEFTVVPLNAVSDSLGERMARFLVERSLKQKGATTNITVRKRRPGDQDQIVISK